MGNKQSVQVQCNANACLKSYCLDPSPSFIFPNKSKKLMEVRIDGPWFIISINGNWLQTDGTPCYTENKIIQYVREKFSE